MADEGDEIALTAGFDAQNAKSVIRIVDGDACVDNFLMSDGDVARQGFAETSRR